MSYDSEIDVRVVVTPKIVRAAKSSSSYSNAARF